MKVAGCRFCGNTSASRRPVGELGNPAGPCPRCGHLMFWMMDAEGEDQTRGDQSRQFEPGSVKQAVGARRAPGPRTGATARQP